MTSPAACRLCGWPGMRRFYSALGVPVHNVCLMRSREEALACPKGDIELSACAGCGFIQNDAFDPSTQTYSADYEETQACSPRFRSYAADLARRISARYRLAGGTVVEIGCGKGDFLALLCEATGGKGIGFDPSWAPGRVQSPALPRIEFVPDYYENHLSRLAEADAVVCRHTLEHIAPVRTFLQTLRGGLGGRTDCVVVFEVPDTERILRERAFWDVYYEHCSYFSAGSLSRLFALSGFLVADLRLEFEGQYLVLEALPAERPPDGPRQPDSAGIVERVQEFSRSVEDERNRWSKELAALKDAGKRVILWGSGSKVVAFLSLLGRHADLVEYVVDINPRKQGTWSPGTGHPILGPDTVSGRPPDAVVVMNPAYTDEIRRELQARGLSPRILTLPLDR